MTNIDKGVVEETLYRTNTDKEAMEEALGNII